MSVLVIQLPPRDRLGPRTPGHEPAAGLHLPPEWDFCFSVDGRTVAQTGRAAAALLPRADDAVLVLADADVSWHRVAVPKAPSARLRTALAGVMEEALLDDDDAVHLALAPDAAPGREGWVAAMHRPRLLAALTALESAGLSVRRVVPSSLPAGLPGAARGHFFADADGEDAVPWLALSRADGVACVRLSGALARALQPDATQPPLRWSATPAAAAAAERWLGAAVTLMSEAERTLEAANGGANLRQFDLAAQTRGTRRLAEIGRRMLSRDWRPVRWGLAGLVAVQLLGLNVYAWQQRQAVTQRRDAMTALLRSAHPGVRAVLDAPLQMERETDRLRTAAGRAGDADLEALLSGAAAAWPDAQGPVPTLRFEPGRLTLAVPGWGEAQVLQFRERLKSAGYSAEFADGRVTVGRGAARGAPS